MQGLQRPSSLLPRARSVAHRAPAKRGAVIVRADGSLLEALQAAPPAALAAGAATVLGALGAVFYAASQQGSAETVAEEAAAPGPEPLPRKNAVLLVGAGGRMGRQLASAVGIGRRGY